MNSFFSWPYFIACMASVVSKLNDPTIAYIGPGAGLTAIGAFLAIIAAIVVALFGFIWYPMKRLIRALRKNNYKAKGSQAE